MFALLATTSFAKVLASEPRWYLTGAGGRALVPFLGSEDPRDYYTIGLAYAIPERKFRFRKNRAELVLEAYYERSRSPGASEQPPNGTDAYGLLAMARYRFGAGFFDLGWGLQYTDQRTVDISSRLSSTPTCTLGVISVVGGREVLLGVRFTHISNGGLAGNNQGSNQFGLFGAFRF